MSQESEKSMINSPKLHHFGILTAHTEEMMNWYAKVLDMTTNFWSTTSGIAFLSNDKANHRIGLISWPGLIDDPDKRPHTKLHHVAFEYATIDDLLNTWERLKGLSIEPVLAADHGFTTAFYYHDPDGNNEVHQAGAKVLEAFRAYFLELVVVRSRHPQTALLDAIIRARDEQNGQFSDEELAAICINIIFAGTETTTYLLVNLLLTLLSHPEQWSLLLHNRSLVRPAIEEAARYETPVQFFGRGVSEESILRGKHLRKGQLVFAVLGAANRNPEVYPDPDRFDITRFANKSTRPHLTFGRGFRYCLGAQLGRLEAEVVLETCLSRFPTLRIAEAIPQWKPVPVVRTPETLPVTW